MTAGEIAQSLYDYVLSHSSADFVLAFAGILILALLILRFGRRRR